LAFGFGIVGIDGSIKRKAIGIVYDIFDGLMKKRRLLAMPLALSGELNKEAIGVFLVKTLSSLLCWYWH